MKHASLFSGIGGFDLAAEWMDWENVFHCEINPFSCKVLNYHFSKSISYNDIKTTDFRIHRGQIDILTGGFPCQPYSLAGKRLGKEDERHLWPEMLRAIREIQPLYIVGENVFGLLNWSGGLVFNEVQTDLENEGYQVQPIILPACGINAPHRRDRIWFVAFKDTNKNGRRSYERKNKPNIRQFRYISTGNNEQLPANNEKITTNTECIRGRKVYKDVQHKFSNGTEFNCFSIQWNAAHTYSNRQHRSNGKNEKHTSKRGFDALNDIEPFITAHTIGNGSQDGRTTTGRTLRSRKKRRVQQFERKSTIPNWNNFPLEPPICSGDDGFSDQLDNITFSKWRTESIKAYGNAIVPLVVYQIFKVINQLENEKKHLDCKD